MSESHYLASDVEQYYLKQIAALTARAEQAEAENAFVTRLLKLMGNNDCCDSMFWHSRTESGALRFVMNCGDVFFWGSADCEEITPENIDVLERSFADCKAIDDSFWAYNGPMLFCARVRGERPQGACYPSDERFWPLFDACGPEREVGLGNPYKPGEYKPRNYLQAEKAARERAEQEVVRLREALQAIEKFGHGDGHGRGYTCANMARTALGDKESKDG